MTKICFLIPDGVGIRNYLYSGVLRNLKNHGFDLQIWHSLDKEVISLSEKITGVMPTSIDLKIFPDDGITQLLREASSYSRLLHNVRITQNDTLMANWSFGTPSLQKKILIKLAEIIGARVKTYESILSLESKLWKRLRKTVAYKNSLAQLKEANPDLLFCTHQRMSHASAAILAAQDLGIKTATAIFSWDNLPKARLAMRPDYFLVWSDYMKNEFKFFYPEIDDDRIIVTGTPQFDFYSDSEQIVTRDIFAKKFNLDPAKRWVLFSGDDAKTSPHDHKYLKDVAEALINDTDIQIIFRQVPVEGVERYIEVLEAFPNITHINPFWKKGSYWQDFFPFPEDISHLVNLAYHCDAVINIGSTMALDFAFFDKPGLYLKYDHDPKQTWSVNEVYKFQHFKSMEGLDAVGWISSQSEIRQKIRIAIDSPSSIGIDRKKWLSKIVYQEGVKKADQILTDFFLQIRN